MSMSRKSEIPALITSQSMGCQIESSHALAQKIYSRTWFCEKKVEIPRTYMK